MQDRVFLDTNMIIYLYSEDETSKRDVVAEFLNMNNCFVSTQILSEATNVWCKKYSKSKAQIINYLNEVEAVCHAVIIVHRKTIKQALAIKERYKFSYYDCLMISSALEGSCGVLLTEDLQNGQIIDDRLRILNPFA
jgi:predicted nucleic acid-binding protein